MWISSVYANSTYTPTTNDIGNSVYLKNGETTINGWNFSMIDFLRSNNTFLNGIIYGWNNNKLYITCTNGYITSLSWYNSSSNIIPTTTPYTWQQEQVVLSVLSWNFKNITLKCNPFTSPIKDIEEKTININYNTISKSTNSPYTTLNLSTPTNPEITGQDIKNKLSSAKDIKTQPTFVDILFLQLKTIWNLSDSVLNQNSNLNLANLFKNTSKFKNYSNWINKFSAYTTKKEFQDAFTWAIWLKDVWIAQDVIKWLYDCTLNNNCKGSIKFKHGITDKYSTYSLDEISHTLYSKTNNILTSSINYYSNLQKTCSNSSNSISDTFLKTQAQNICNKLFTDQVDPNNLQNYDLGYSLWVRVRNLQTIKNTIPTSWLNLKGVFNIYWELDNLTLGTNKATIIESIKNTPSLTGKYEKIRKIFKKDLEEISNKKVEDSKFKTILETNVKILEPDNFIIKEIKDQNKNIDFTNKDDFEIISTENWSTIVKLKWMNLNTTNISSLKDLAKLPEYSDKVKIIFKEKKWTWKDSVWLYEEKDW